MTKVPRRSWLWLQGLVCGALTCLATPTALLLGTLLAPGAIVWIMEREAGKPNARAMLLCSLVFSFPVLQELWSRGHTIAVSLDLLQSHGALAWAWAGACAGWLLREGAWIIFKLVSEAMDLRRRSILKAERAALEAEWGTIGPAPGLPMAGQALSV